MLCRGQEITLEVVRPRLEKCTSLSQNRHEYDGLSRLTYACAVWDFGTAACQGDSFTYQYDGAGSLLGFSRWNGSAVETVRFVS